MPGRFRSKKFRPIVGAPRNEARADLPSNCQRGWTAPLSEVNPPPDRAPNASGWRTQRSRQTDPLTPSSGSPTYNLICFLIKHILNNGRPGRCAIILAGGIKNYPEPNFGEVHQRFGKIFLHSHLLRRWFSDRTGTRQRKNFFPSPLTGHRCNDSFTIPLRITV